MEEKTTKFTLRLTEQQCNQLKEGAKEASMTVSDYVRSIMFGNFSPTLSNSTEKMSRTSPPFDEKIVALNKELVRLEHDIEMLHGIKEPYKTDLRERIDEIWHILN